MDTVDYAKATGLAAALLCAACQFETGPLSLQGDLAPAETNDRAAEPVAPFDNPTMGAATASPGSQQKPGAPSATQPDASLPSEGSSANAGSSSSDPQADPAPIPNPDPAPIPNPDPAPIPNPDPDPVPDPDAAVALDASTPSGPAPGTVFSGCLANTDCDQGLVCTTTLAALSGTPLERGYCAAFCNWTSGGVADPCPQPASGLVKNSCLPGTSLCLLGSCDRSLCPSEMQCVEVATPIGAGQVRTDFTCQP